MLEHRRKGGRLRRIDPPDGVVHLPAARPARAAPLAHHAPAARPVDGRPVQRSGDGRSGGGADELRLGRADRRGAGRGADRARRDAARVAGPVRRPPAGPPDRLDRRRRRARIRDEGTSHHYLPPGDEVARRSRPRPVARRDAGARGCPVRVGPTWSTDAPYRETREDVLQLAGEGVLAVDMELAALLAVAAGSGVSRRPASSSSATAWPAASGSRRSGSMDGALPRGRLSRRDRGARCGR